MGIWSRKSIEQLTVEANAQGEQRLHRQLGVFTLTAFGVGSTIGAGIFVLTGSVAATHAGPAVALSFLFASIACLFAGLCYAEFAAMVPVAGSAYSYAYATMGELIAWIIGWCISLEYIFSASVVAIGWSGYLTSALSEIGFPLPEVLASAPLKLDAADHLMASGTWIDLPATLVVLACTGLLLLGMRQSALANALIVVAKVVAVIVVIVVGAQYVDAANWHPFIPLNRGEFGQFGWSGVMMGAGIVFFSYIGFDGVSTLAEDTRDPQKTMPKALLASMLICTVLYIAVALVITGLVDYRQLDVPDPIYLAMSHTSSSLAWLKGVIVVIVIFGLIATVLMSLIGQIRINFAMGRDGLLPTALSRTSGQSGTPVLGTIVTGVISAAMAGFVPFALLGELISIGTLLAFAIVCAGIPILRRTAPEAHRPFRTPWVPLIPILGVLSCFALMFSLPNDTWIRLVVWLALGLVVYFSYGRRHSRLSRPVVQ
jgi:APA family basic amino acid/polyamine antiporter